MGELLSYGQLAVRSTRLPIAGGQTLQATASCSGRERALGGGATERSRSVHEDEPNMGLLTLVGGPWMANAWCMSPARQRWSLSWVLALISGRPQLPPKLGGASFAPGDHADQIHASD